MSTLDGDGYGYGYGNGYGYDNGYGNGNGDGNGTGNGTGNGYGNGKGYGSGYGDGEAVLEEMGIPNALKHLFLPLSNETLELANTLLNCNTSLEYESILGILELRND